MGKTINNIERSFYLKKINIILLAVFCPLVIVLFFYVKLKNPDMDFFDRKLLLSNYLLPILICGTVVYSVYFRIKHKINTNKKTDVNNYNIEDLTNNSMNEKD